MWAEHHDDRAFARTKDAWETVKCRTDRIVDYRQPEADMWSPQEQNEATKSGAVALIKHLMIPK
jgi:hypothetical protein